MGNLPCRGECPPTRFHEEVTIMMKKMLALLLAMMLTLSCTAVFADESADNGTLSLTLTVSDQSGNPVSGAKVTVKDEQGKETLSTTADDSGMVRAALKAGTYVLRATDADNYSVKETVSLTEDTALTLTVRTLTPGSEVTVGTVSRPTGYFATELFSNNTSDIDVRALLHGYSTVAFTEDASYQVDDSVVTLVTAAQDDLGNKMYQFRVKEGLCYNDGTPITAKDYVFSVLMQASKQMKDIGGTTAIYWQVLGYDEYNSGERNYLSGLRLLDDMTFSINLRTDALPYYYELMLVNVTPYPISEIAPGCDVKDNGRGAYLTGDFTAELLQETMLDPETGYSSHPKVTSGAYQLESYDAATGTVVMKANPYYQGNYAGQRPLIETVTLKETTNDQAIAQLEDGTLDIVNKLTDSTAIDAGLADDQLQSSSYLRTGLGFLSFACEQGPTSQVEVRQAVDYCLDQDTFVTEFTGTYGQPVYSWYGLGQWMVTEGNYLNTMKTQVTTYPLNLTKAAKMLEKAGYIYNEKGERFDAKKDTVRYRALEGTALTEYENTTDPVVKAVTAGGKTLLPLQIRFAKVTNNRMCQLVEDLLLPNLQEVGFDVSVEEMSYSDMLAQYYRDDTRTCNLYALATNFTYVYDPTNTWRPGEEYQGHVNTTGLESNDLYVVARALRSTEPGDTAAYMKQWVILMNAFSTRLPAIPLYSNTYYDFCASSVHGYEPSSNWSWSAAILYTYVDDAAATATDVP